MRKALSLGFLCVAVFTVFCLTLSTVPSAQAGKATRVSKQHVKGGHGFASKHHRSFRRGQFNRHGFRNHRRGKSYAIRRDRHRYGRHRRSSYGRYYSGYGSYYTGYAYPYWWRTSYGSVPRYRPETRTVVQPYQTPPVTPKWVSVGDTNSTLGSKSAEAPNIETAARKNCLSVKTEIMVDGKPYDAFGEACLVADGSWEFRPTESKE